jgi:DNA-binding MarR family transcriptional regulator
LIDEHLEVARLTRELASHLLERATINSRHFNMGVTEVRAVEQLYLQGPMTSGELGRALALTSGSVTALVNRLLRQDMVIREIDPRDRRKVWISFRPDRIEQFLAPYLSTIEKGQAIVQSYSKEDLAIVLRFLTDYCNASTDATAMIARELSDNRPKKRRAGSSKTGGANND